MNTINGINEYCSDNQQVNNYRKEVNSSGGFEAMIKKFEAMKAALEAAPTKSMTAIAALDTNIAKFKALNM